jgi:magnesium transporter
MMVAFVISLTLVIAVLFSKIVGCLLPIGAQKVGIDPTVMASPFITAIVDAISLLVYFTVASMFLEI